MGWIEEKEKADRMELEAKSKRKRFIDSDFNMESEGGQNIISLLGGVTGSNEFPGTEPEDSWIRELDRISITREAFQKKFDKHVSDMPNWPQFKGRDWGPLGEYYINIVKRFRPELLKRLGYNV